MTNKLAHYLLVLKILLLLPQIQSLFDDIWNLQSTGEILSNYYSKLLNDLHRERSYDTLLLLHQGFTDSFKVKQLLEYPVPKVSLRAGYEFSYYLKFNWEILVVIYMSQELDYQLMLTAAKTLEFMRQARIIVMADEVPEKQDSFKYELLQLCEKYKMTNVLLDIFYDNGQKEKPRYLQLKPYPLYHWQFDPGLGKEHAYYPLHWLNMHNKTLITYTDQTLPRVLLFRDHQGNLQLNGYVARMVQLFAEYFNAHLKMYRPLKEGNVFHITVLLNMTKDGELDIPMAVDTGTEVSYTSYTFDATKGMLMVPCALPKTTQEIFRLLLDVKFVAYISVCCLTLSVAHSLIDYYLLDVKESVNFIIHDHILPGVLGQSFAVRISQLTILRVIYILVGFVGLNVAALFSGHLHTLLTKPPYNRQIASFEDLVQSPLKILMDANEAVFFMHHLEPFKKSLILTRNTSLVMHMRHTFNTTYGYYVYSSSWGLYTRRQQFFTHKVFCTSKELLVHHLVPCGLRLQYNSPYMEAMNYLVHRVHQSGLIEAWHSSTFADMLRLKQFSIRDPSPGKIWIILNANDLLWVWLVVVVGLVSSSLVFLIELWLGKLGRRVNKK